jgi:hypothetical protein
MISLLRSTRSSGSLETTVDKKKAISELEKAQAELREMRRELKELIARVQAKTTR